MITRLHSQTLDMPIKHDSETGTVTIKDLVYNTNKYVEYSENECRVIKSNFKEIDKTVHSVKKIFDGEIVNKEYNRPAPTETGITEPTQIDLF
jgi:protein associated with RNAse G/E